MDTLKLKAPSFADRFSLWKRRVLALAWTLVLVFGLKASYPTLKSFYAIKEAKSSYYTIRVVDNRAIYSRTDQRPAEWVSLDQISKRIQGAIIASEDGKFYEHPGYDLEQLTEAVEQSVKSRNRKKKKVRGASTITQQLVKNLFLNTERSLFRKGQEMIMALAMEKYSDKKTILETYLNIIEYGKGVYGIQAATQYYFKKKPQQINAREAAFLAMLLPSPVKYAKSFHMKALTPFALKMVESILLKMRQGGVIGEEEYAQALATPFSWEQSSPDLSVAEAQLSEEDDTDPTDLTE